jgi:hypothetical protein
MLVEALAPYWGGEAEVVRAYFESSTRTAATDRVWLARQCHKELVDGVDVRLPRLQDALADATVTDRRRLLRWATEAAEELHHCCLFAEVHDALGGESEPPLVLATVRQEWSWNANDALRALRETHRSEHGELGWRALVVTEGGCGVLYAAGAALAGRSPRDDLIAGACQHVLDDEFDHVLEGIAGDDAQPSDDWPLLRDLCVAQSVARIRMRDEQFEHPVHHRRLDELVDGGGCPISFDWQRAGFRPPL